ncbi:biotin--[acetyl-CoA-carboxylase] ligase [Thermomicrobiaceae bacterium CFH 74404]|uniref:Biotin--[acetyl-CoA-carboxylase] ligase n=1 Tax=Thermalbibacter longus TaxID=2951981 RepID=A0AA42BBA5_9BACT|nr:biotin--[acetyl-CoA-carboxylase] ligase [Thermalbibacter longus]MCM8749550.1 biotin--[acetyl-CoA-carboxylase] ligase [Thermalbibacter longus]
MWRIEWHDRVTSTMDLAAERADAGEPAGLVVVAEEQTQGRGRHGRRWDAPHGTSLLFTVLSRPPLALVQDELLSVRVAERVADAIARLTGLRVVIKEPNDLLVNGRKLAGILLQSRIEGQRLDYLLIGIGINVNVPPEQLPLPSATSILAETGHLVDRRALLLAVLEELSQIENLLPRSVEEGHYYGCNRVIHRQYSDSIDD